MISEYIFTIFLLTNCQEKKDKIGAAGQDLSLLFIRQRYEQKCSDQRGWGDVLWMGFRGVETVLVGGSVLWEANMKRVVEYSLNPS